MEKMFEWFWNMLKKEEPKEEPNEEPELRIRKPRIFICTKKECKTVENYSFTTAFKKNFECPDCHTKLVLI